jgi:spore maturation protein CgeB
MSAPRVLVVGSTRAADSLEWHVMDTFQAMGVAASFFQAEPGFARTPTLNRAVNKLTETFLREPERRIEQGLLAAVRDLQPTLILVIQGKQLSPKTVTKLRAVTRAPIACWCQDAVTSLGRQYLLGAGYDVVFVKDRYMQDLFSRMIRSTTFRYLAEACNPRVHRTVELSAADQQRYGCDVMIAGTLYYYRQEILRQLSGINLRVWGTRPRWLQYQLADSHQGPAIVMDEKAKALRAARICLNPLHFGEVNALNCRAFEIAGCGGFQLVGAVPVISEHFQPGAELVTYNSAPELVELVHYYLRNPLLAGEIARRGQLRAHTDHTYEIRLREILKVCG